MKGHPFCKLLAIAGVGAVLAAPPVARADLTNPVLLGQLAPLEQISAISNQAVYDRLIGSGTCADQEAGPVGACTGVVFQVFDNVRELVHTSNELTGSGPRQYSLGLDVQNLGFALRWTAAEELAAQGDSATQFSNNQIGALANRMSALRFGARGFVATGRSAEGGDVLMAGAPHALGGGAAADDESIASRWGGFIDGSFGYGRRSDSTFKQGFEDAFAFDGQEVTAGVDYRFTDSFVAGILVGHTDKTIDFDSSLSVVDARIDAKGFGTIAYALWEKQDFYVSGSLGGQWLKHDFVRRITYPSFNPLVAPVNEVANSNTDSSAITATVNVGYSFRAKAFSFEPYVKAEYQKVTVDGFTESGAHGFDFDYGSQDIKSLETSAGIKLQYVFTPSFGVIVPFLRGEFRHQSEDKSRDIQSIYAGIASLVASTPGATFAVPTDAPDKSYYSATGGFSVVLPHGLQGFLQYGQIFQLDQFTDHVISGGVRLEF